MIGPDLEVPMSHEPQPATSPPRTDRTELQTRYDALLDLYHGGAFDEARECCGQLLESAPGHGGALQLMGVLQARRGDFEAAVELFDRAIAAAPEVASAYNNRGNALLALDRAAKAVASYDQAIALKLESADALNNRGTALQALLRLDEALASFEHAVAIEPELAAAHLNRGELLLEIGDRGAAIDALRLARDAGADSDKIGFTLASLGVEAPARVAPAGFVRELFDGYALRFDRHLVDRLEYRVPQMVADAVTGLDLSPPLDIIDLGCGTGLCAPLLRPHARRLDGVDLSSNMLERAHQLELYDNLACGELVEHLRERPQAFDIAIAADVLIYFGDLATVFAAVRRTLRGRGWFVFSIEAADEAPYLLRPTRRYAHARGYVETLAAAQGFDVKRIDAVVLRTEGRVDVAGHLVVLQSTGEP
jgi:predicted TPR repeat methyltransferase